MSDALRIVQRHHRLEPGQARRHHLGSAAEAGEEVRLDESGRDADVGVQPLAIQVDGHAGRRRSDDSEALDASRASWLTTRHRRTSSEPSMRSSSSGVLARWVPVAIRIVMSSWRTPGISASSASIVWRRGCARVMSQTEMAIRCPGRASSRSGGQPMGARIARSSVPCGIRRRRPRHRLDDRDPLVGQLDLEPVSAVVQSQSHARLPIPYADLLAGVRTGPGLQHPAPSHASQPRAHATEPSHLRTLYLPGV